jgi:DNA-binding GntR family transcriptional regulator
MERKTARDLIVDHLREAILRGDLAPGARLNVNDVANALDVSHTPTREAFQQLAADGLLRIQAFRGARVAELSAEECQEIYLMRVGLEGLAARLGAESIDDADVAAMRESLAEMCRSAKREDVDAFLTVDRAFHRAHYLASGRDRLWERIIGLRYTAERYTRLGYTLPSVGLEDTIESHEAILEAIAARDGEAAQRLVEDDLRRTYEAVFAHLSASALAPAD